MGARIRLPLRVLLPCVAVCLVACGAAATGAVWVAAAGGYALRQADDGLRACASSMLGRGPLAVAGSGAVPGQVPPVPCGMELLSVSGRVLIPAPAGWAPAIPASGRWLAAHLAGPVTVPGPGGGRWRVVITAVRYQAQRMPFVFVPDDLRYLISGPDGRGSAGRLVVMAALAGTGQLAADYAAAAGAVLVLLAAAAFAVTRAVVRPLLQAARLAAAGSLAAADGPGAADRLAAAGGPGAADRLAAAGGPGAGGRPADVMASLGALTDLDHGRYATAAAAAMRERLQASHAAEAAARTAADGMAGQLEQTCLQLRRPAAIVHGFTEYCHIQGTPPSAGLDQMMQRVADEITRMDTLIEGLGTRPAGQPAPCAEPGRNGQAVR